MTRRLRFPDGSVETFRDDGECDLNFQMLAFAGREVAMTTEGGRPLALARQGRIEERDLVLAGTPVEITTPRDRFMSNLVAERRRVRSDLASYVPAASIYPDGLIAGVVTFKDLAEATIRADRITVSEIQATHIAINPELLQDVEHPSLERRPPLAYPLVLAVLIAVVLIGAIIQTAANLSAGVQ